MPTTRTRRARTWSPRLDDYRWAALIEGPDTTLIDGKGYPALHERGASDADKLAALAEARADWETHREAILTWFVGVEMDASRKPWIWPAPGGPGTRPWAWWQFDAPEARGADETQGDYLTRLGLLLPGETIPSPEAPK